MKIISMLCLALLAMRPVNVVRASNTIIPGKDDSTTVMASIVAESARLRRQYYRELGHHRRAQAEEAEEAHRERFPRIRGLSNDHEVEYNGRKLRPIPSKSSSSKSSKSKSSKFNPVEVQSLAATSVGTSTHAEFLCLLFEVFDELGRHENNDKDIPGLDWSSICDDMEGLDPYLCPSNATVQNLCSQAGRPELNPAIKAYYCIPLLQEINSTISTERFEDCVLYCTNYVSPARGGCCESVHCDS